MSITHSPQLVDKLIDKLADYEKGRNILSFEFCGYVQILDLDNKSHAKDVQENKHKRCLIGNSRLLSAYEGTVEFKLAKSK